MNRNHRLVLSLATTAGLFGGAWHSLGSIPVSRTVSSSQSGSTSVLVVPAAELSLSPLLANLDSGNDAVSRLQAQLSDLEAAIRRAERVRALMIARQAAATPATFEAMDGAEQKGYADLALEVDQVVRDAIAENTLIPRNIEAA
ncbi:MAG: hypothetical protein ABI418_00875, partial [Jatrophihabitantaceae bacterium]